MAARIDAVLKLGVIASLLIASSGVAYYYGVYLPNREAQFDNERSLAKLRTYGQMLAEQERKAVEQRQLQQREAAMKVTAEDRYRSCLTSAAATHDVAWTAQCNSIARKAIADHADCLAKANLSRGYCDAAYRTPDASPHCTLPVEIATDLDGTLNIARNRCLQDRNAALQ